MTFRYHVSSMCKVGKRLCLVSRRLQLPDVKNRFPGVDQSTSRPPLRSHLDPTPQETHRLLLQIGRTTRAPDTGLDLFATLVEGLLSALFVSFVCARGRACIQGRDGQAYILVQLHPAVENQVPADLMLLE